MIDLMNAACIALFLAAATTQAQTNAPPAEPPPASAPSLESAVAGARAALATCAARGWPHVAVTVLDSGGEIKAMLAADGTPPGHAIPRSAMKAATALAYRIPSAEVQARAASDPAFAASVAADPRLLPRPGGLPIIVGGALIGAIGVSGAPGGDKDALCAQAGLARLVASR